MIVFEGWGWSGRSETRKPSPGSGHPKLDTQNPSPETQNTRLGTPEPEIRNTEYDRYNLSRKRVFLTQTRGQAFVYGSSFEVMLVAVVVPGRHVVMALWSVCV